MEYHNNTLKTSQKHHEEETQNNNSHTKARIQLKYSSQLSFPQQDDFKAKKDNKLCITKQASKSYLM